MPDDRQRIDKWLWHARVVRTRSAAAALAQSGHVRLNGMRVDAPARPVKPGDVLTIALDRGVRVLKVLGFSVRRGASEAGRALYEDLSPVEAPGAAPEQRAAVRDPGAGRPSKHERRAIARFTHPDEP